MPLPIAPIAFAAFRYGGLALVVYSAARRIGPAPTHQANEDALDRVDDGLGVSHARDRQQINLQARWRRVVRFGRAGPGLDVDFASLGRVRFRRV